MVVIRAIWVYKRGEAFGNGIVSLNRGNIGQIDLMELVKTIIVTLMHCMIEESCSS